MPSRLLLQTIAVASLLAGPSIAAQTPAVIPIDFKSYSYTPSPLRLRAGRPVTLTFTNRSGGGHDFTAKAFFRSAKILSGDVGEGEIELRPGQSRSVTLVPAAGRYPVHCGHAFHKMLGMKSEIVVN